VLYVAALVYAQKVYLVAINSTVKDSPYVLGFILTMAALTKIFRDIAGVSGGTLGIPIRTVVGEAGTAILATVVGLFGRQLLLSLDPLEYDRDLQFQSIAQQVRDSTAEFHRTQRRFLGLVEEFVSARERLFSREESASTAYVQRLESHNQLLVQLEQQYPARIANITKALDDAIDELKRGVTVGATELTKFNEALSSVLASEGEALGRAVVEGNSRLVAGNEQMSRHADAANAAFEHLAQVLRGRAEEVREISASFPPALKDVSASFAQLTTESRSAHEEMLHLRDGLRVLSESLSSSDRMLSQSSISLAEGFDQRAASLRADLESIDAIVEELVKVLRHRMQAAASF
jgi:hypothetical protein